MKIKLSKNQWEAVGKKAGWMKQSEDTNNATRKDCSYCGREYAVRDLHELKRGKVWCCDKCLDKHTESETKAND